jgi:hypothetical protein
MEFHSSPLRVLAQADDAASDDLLIDELGGEGPMQGMADTFHSFSCFRKKLISSITMIYLYSNIISEII